MHPAFDLTGLIVRAAFVYLSVLALFRLSGKRALAEGTAVDFVMAIVLGDLVDDLFFGDVSGAQFSVAATTLVGLELLTSWLCTKSPALERILDGQPVRIMRDGELLPSGTRREHLHENEVAMLVRQTAGLERERWHEIAEARVELDGNPSVVRHDWARDARRIDVAASRADS